MVSKESIPIKIISLVGHGGPYDLCNNNSKDNLATGHFTVKNKRNQGHILKEKQSFI